jgi:hypothetical protein
MENIDVRWNTDQTHKVACANYNGPMGQGNTFVLGGYVFKQLVPQTAIDVN